MASEGEPASVFQALPAGNKYRVEISGVTPMTYTGMMGFRGGFDRERPVVTSTSTYQSQRQPVRGPAVMPGRRGFEIVEIASLAFWDAYLGHQTAARELLQPEKFDASFSGATITAK